MNLDTWEENEWQDLKGKSGPLAMWTAALQLSDLKVTAGTHATAAQGRGFVTRLQRPPSAPQHRGPVHPRRRTLQELLSHMRLECVWLDRLGPYSSTTRKPPAILKLNPGLANSCSPCILCFGRSPVCDLVRRRCCVIIAPP